MFELNIWLEQNARQLKLHKYHPQLSRALTWPFFSVILGRFSGIQPQLGPTGFRIWLTFTTSSFFLREFSSLRLRQHPCPGVCVNPQELFLQDLRGLSEGLEFWKQHCRWRILRHRDEVFFAAEWHLLSSSCLESWRNRVTYKGKRTGFPSRRCSLLF